MSQYGINIHRPVRHSVAETSHHNVFMEVLLIAFELRKQFGNEVKVSQLYCASQGTYYPNFQASNSAMALKLNTTAVFSRPRLHSMKAALNVFALYLTTLEREPEFTLPRLAACTRQAADLHVDPSPTGRLHDDHTGRPSPPQMRPYCLWAGRCDDRTGKASHLP